MAASLNKDWARYAEVYGVDPRTIRNWHRAGYPLDDEAETRRLVEAQHRAGGNSVDHAEAKRLKVLAELERIKWNLEKDKGNFISRDEVREAGITIGAVLSAELSAILNDMPGALAGLAEVDIRQRLSSRFELLKEKVKQELASESIS